MTLQADQFEAFFRELWGYGPFPWQRRLAALACQGEWPDTLDLPTASGKTACLDIAVFAMAVQAPLSPAERSVGRRIFFVVNRRVIVDEAYERAQAMALKLRRAEKGTVLSAVADALRRLSGDADAPPLDVAILRGGLYRDNRWARSITQPTLITSTIDQVGSRLLFRGYGVSPAARPLHAALVAHDSLLLLDEAHISRPFAQTLEAVARYRSDAWAEEPILTPFKVVQMSATPGSNASRVFGLDQHDRDHSILHARLHAAKPARLVVAKKAKGDRALDELAKVMAKEATRLRRGDRRTVAVIANRVSAARRIYALLKEQHKDQADVILAIGRMRPFDRDRLTKVIQARVGKTSEQADSEKPLFVVATQCLEVGADFDFDAMVTECASLDALRQRFGRLNRRGRGIEAQACIVIRGDQVKSDKDLDKMERDDKRLDPIYGYALSRTWNWLKSIADKDENEKEEKVDFGSAAIEARLDGVRLDSLLVPNADAPIMFPAYVDAWAQTHPAPAPDPDIALFLHGPQRGEPEVQVCWRADLSEEPAHWASIVSLCPPSSTECMPVPIGAFRAWLRGEGAGADGGDVLETPADWAEEEEAGAAAEQRLVLVWRGPDSSQVVTSPREIRPGDTLVLPLLSGGWDELGHIPVDGGEPTNNIDIGEQAFRLSHGKPILRLTPERLASWPEDEAVAQLREWLADPDADLTVNALRETLRQIADILPDEFTGDAEALRLLADPRYGLAWERYPAPLPGLVFTTRRRVRQGAILLPILDDGDDETSRLAQRSRVALDDHAAHVLQTLEETLTLTPAARWGDALKIAARLHDIGKADERFQALLLNGDLSDAWAQPKLWAKSERLPLTPAQRLAARRRSGLPDGFRHEMLSFQLAEQASHMPEDALARSLILHLIASHHGRGRPFAPVVIDDEPPDVAIPDQGIKLTRAQRIESPPHRLDSGVVERFWRLTRRFGWWGLAYLEALLRLADQRASQKEDEGDFSSET